MRGISFQQVSISIKQSYQLSHEEISAC